MKMPKLYAIQSKQPAPRRLSGPKKELIYVDASNVLIESDAHVLDMRELLKLHKEDLKRGAIAFCRRSLVVRNPYAIRPKQPAPRRLPTVRPGRPHSGLARQQAHGQQCIGCPGGRPCRHPPAVRAPGPCPAWA